MFFLYHYCSLTGVSAFLTGYKFIVRPWFIYMSPLLKATFQMGTNFVVLLSQHDKLSEKGSTTYLPFDSLFSFLTFLTSSQI